MVYLASGEHLQHGLRHDVRRRVSDAVQLCFFIFLFGHSCLLSVKENSHPYGARACTSRGSTRFTLYRVSLRPVTGSAVSLIVMGEACLVPPFRVTLAGGFQCLPPGQALSHRPVFPVGARTFTRPGHRGMDGIICLNGRMSSREESYLNSLNFRRSTIDFWKNFLKIKTASRETFCGGIELDLRPLRCRRNALTN